MKKGFTLIEMLVIIVILSTITIIVLPRIGGNNKKNREYEYNRIKTIIENSAKIYHLDNKLVNSVSVSVLKNNNLLTDNISSEIDEYNFNGCVKITQNENRTYSYNYSDICEKTMINLTVNKNGGTTSFELNSNYYTGDIVDLPIPTMDNAIFVHWEVTSGDSLIRDNKLIVGNNDTTISAIFKTAINLTVDLDSGTITTNPQGTYYEGDTVTLENPTRDNYEFTGWEITSGNSTINGNILTIGTTDTTLYAMWELRGNTVSFNANGGNGGQSSNVFATYGSAMPSISTTAPTRSGYEFMGWYDNATYTSGTQYYTAAGASARSWDKMQDTTLYAGWKANTYWNDVNIMSPSGVQDYKSGYIRLSRDGVNWTGNLVNEDATTNEVPYGGKIYVKWVGPYYDYYELDRVTGADWDSSTGSYVHTVTAANQVITLYTRYKSSYTKNGVTYTRMSSSNIPLGTYISYQSATSGTVTIGSDYTGYTPTTSYPNTLTPSELTLWRVIKNNSGTIDIISNYTSSSEISFYGQPGYKNLIYGLQYIASLYQNSTYSSGYHYFGYNGQTLQCSNLCSGDSDYQTEYDTVKSVLGDAKAYKNNTTTYVNYHLASRYNETRCGEQCAYEYDLRYISTSGYVSRTELYGYFATIGWSSGRIGRNVRPVITLKNTITYYCPATSSTSAPCELVA